MNWSHFLVGFWANIAPIARFDGSVCTWNSSFHLGGIEIGALK